MHKSQTKESAIASLLTLSILIAGCAEPKPTAPKLSLEDTVNQVAELTEQILKAFETGDPKAADPPLHKIGHSLTNMLKQAKAEAVSEEKLTSLKSHINDLLDGFEGELHEFMHGGSVPEDYDIAPLAKKLRSTVASLKADLGISDGGTDTSEPDAAETNQAIEE